jgi:hypothetical protein
MQTVKWFIDKLKDPSWVDRPEEDLPDWLQEDRNTPVIPRPGGPVPPPQPAPVDMTKDQMPGLLGEGMDSMKEPVGEENQEGSMVTPFSKKMRYMANMRGKQTPNTSFLGGGDYGD